MYDITSYCAGYKLFQIIPVLEPCLSIRVSITQMYYFENNIITSNLELKFFKA